MKINFAILWAALGLQGAWMRITLAAEPAAWAVVVEPEAVAERLKAEESGPQGLLLLDARGRKGHDGRYLKQSVTVDAAAWARLALSAEDSLTQADRWRRRILELGVSDHRPVAIVDDGSLTDAARVWFLLQHFGVRGAAVVNGGYPALAPLLPPERFSTELPPPRSDIPPAITTTRPSGSVGLMGRVELKERLGGKDALVLDVRTEPEFRGSEARGNPRPGHLPGAVNLPHPRLLDERGRLKPPAELRAVFEAAGVRSGVRVTMHCQSGGRSSLAALAAVHAGLENVDNYYLSFAEWSADDSCPVER